MEPAMPSPELPSDNSRLPTSAEIRALIESRGAAKSISMLHPLSIAVSVEATVEFISVALQHLPSGESLRGLSNEERLILEQVRQSGTDFLGYLHSRPNSTMQLALYPADEDGLDEIELGDIADIPDDVDEDETLPF